MVSGAVCRFFGQCFISPMFFSRLFIAACCVLRDSLGNSSFGLLFTNCSGNIIYFCHAFRHLPHFFVLYATNQASAKNIKKYNPLPVTMDIYAPKMYKHKEQNHITIFIL